VLQGSTLYLWWASLLVVPAALAAFAVAVATRRPLAAGLAAALSGCGLIRLVPTGNRTFLLVFLGGMVVFLSAHAGRRPGFGTLAVCVILGLVGSYALLNFRDPETRGGVASSIEGLATSPEELFKPVYRGPDSEMAPALAGALQAVPSRLGYRYGGVVFGDLAHRPIPRALWKSKPHPPATQLVGLVWPVAQTRGHFDPAFTPLLFFYWDFGFAGVIVGMAFYGLLARILYAYYAERRENIVAQVLFAAGTLYLVIGLRFDPVLVIVHWVILFVPLIAIFYAGARSGRRDVAASGPRRSPAAPATRGRAGT
jgi:hypothetical protein